MRLNSPIPLIFKLFLGSLTVGPLTACGVELTQGNSEPFVVAVGPISPLPPNTVSLEYTVADFQQDDAEVDVSLCTQTGQQPKCYVAVASPDSPGTSRISTVSAVPNTYSASHLFLWNPSCGLLDPQTNQRQTLPLTTSFYFKVKVSTNSHSAVQSEPTTLQKLGFSTPPSPSNCP